MGTALVDPSRLAYVPPYWDTHGVWCVERYGICTPQLRQRAKALRYDQMYGIGTTTFNSVLQLQSRMHRKPPALKVYKMRASDYATQYAAARTWWYEHTRKLIAEGWQWDGVLQQWTHPDRPGVTITEG